MTVASLAKGDYCAILVCRWFVDAIAARFRFLIGPHYLIGRPGHQQVHFA